MIFKNIDIIIDLSPYLNNVFPSIHLMDFGKVLNIFIPEFSTQYFTKLFTVCTYVSSGICMYGTIYYHKQKCL